MIDVISSLVKEVVGPQATVMPTERSEHGHYFTNAAFSAAKTSGEDPRKTAEKIIEKILSLAPGGMFESIEIAGPGFINFTLSQKALAEEIKKAVEKGDNYGKGQLEKPKKIQVEFISANPTGPLTFGNGRGGPFGDVLSNIFSYLGNEVVKEYYVNDAGGQVLKLGRSVMGEEEAEYKGEYIEDIRRVVKTEGRDVKQVGADAVEEVKNWLKKTVEENMGIAMDVWFSEKSLHENGTVDKVIDMLRSKGLVYENEGALWFKSSEFGDDKDRVIVKSDGEKTYFAGDIAYLWNKFEERGFDKVINIWGADHHGDVARVKGAFKALGLDGEFEILITQFVRLLKDGKEVRMSKRKGVYVTVDEVIEEIGKDAYRFLLLMYSPDSHIDFNMDVAKERSMENPVYYVQYAAVRAGNIVRKSAEADIISGEDLSKLDTREDVALMHEISRFPDIVAEAGLQMKPEYLARYAVDISKKFHAFYDKERIIGEEPDTASARLTLVKASYQVFKNLFGILGISLPDKM